MPVERVEQVLQLYREKYYDFNDYVISDLTVTSADQGPDRKTVTAKFMNIDRREEIHFDFLRNGRRWLLDEVHSTSATPWTLSEILKCSQ